MSRSKKFLALAIAALAVVALGAVLQAQGPAGLSAAQGAPVAAPLTQDLPPVARGAMTSTRSGEALSVLSFDDGTCEAGLGAGITVTDFVDFDVPTQCIQAGLQVVALTAKMNTGTATSFALGQAGAAPPGAGAGTFVPITSNIAGTGPCPGTALTSRSLGGTATISGTSNFFAGLRTPTGFAGRDSNGPAAGRIWLNCGGCGMTQYSPTDLSGLGLGGNWMIRVTVEDQNCIPVELMDFTVSDS